MLNMILIALTLAVPVVSSCRNNLQSANAQLQTAVKANARRDYRAADAALESGLRTLGDHYVSPPTSDDTGMHLVFADSERSRGKLKLAVELKRRVLAERLQLCSSRPGK